MGLPVEVLGTGGRRRPDIRDIFPRGGSGSVTLQIGDVGDISTHLEDAGWLSTLGDKPTNKAESKTSGRQELAVPPNDDVDIRGGLGGGGDIHHTPPEHRHTFHCDQKHYGSMSGSGAAPWGAGIPAVVGIGYSGPRGDAGGEKCSGYDRDGGRRVWG